MAIFQQMTLSWNGRDHTVPADRMLGAIAVIEDIVTFPELIIMMNGKPNMSRLARAYGALLRYAGAWVGDEEVYDGLFKPGEAQKQIAAAINTLLAMMTPPSAIAEAPSSGNRPAAPSSSLKRSSRQRSEAAGSRDQSSGRCHRKSSGGWSKRKGRRKWSAH
jgi:hypothetical protein